MAIWVCLKIVYPYTQWFCWSLSLWKMAISLGILTQHFQTNPKWKITILNGKIHYKWPFSIAFCSTVHQKSSANRSPRSSGAPFPTPAVALRLPADQWRQTATDGDDGGCSPVKTGDWTNEYLGVCISWMTRISSCDMKYIYILYIYIYIYEIQYISPQF